MCPIFCGMIVKVSKVNDLINNVIDILIRKFYNLVITNGQNIRKCVTQSYRDCGEMSASCNIITGSYNATGILTCGAFCYAFYADVINQGNNKNLQDIGGVL